MKGEVSTVSGEASGSGHGARRFCSCGKPVVHDDATVKVEVGGRVITCWPHPSECEECCRERERADYLKRAAEERRDKAAEWWERRQLGRRLEAALDNYQVTDANRAAHTAVTAWTAEPFSNLIIAGPVGSGKSYLAAYAFLKLHEADESVWWLSVPKLVDTIRRSYSNEDFLYEAAELVQYAKEAPILFLDDLGKSHTQNTSWIEEQLYTIINHRYCEMLPTVVTTEYAGEGLSKRVGDSVVSRLEDGAVIAGLKGPMTPWRKPQHAPLKKRTPRNARTRGQHMRAWKAKPARPKH